MSDSQDKYKNSGRKPLDWTAIIVALITLSGVIFSVVYQVPTKNGQSSPALVVVIQAITGNDTSELLLTPEAPEVVITSEMPETPTPIVITATIVPTSPTRIISTTSIPTSTPNAMVVTATPFIQATSMIQDTNSSVLTRNQIDNLFGMDNWYCLGDRYADGVEISQSRNNGIGIKQQQQDINITHPLARISSNNHPAGTTDIAIAGVGAIVDFATGVYLSTSECPTWQIEALENWRNDRIAQGKPGIFSTSDIQNLVGISNFSCNSYFSISFRPATPYVVEYPVMFVSGNQNNRDYGIGEAVPISNFDVTLWVNGSVEICR